MSTNVMLRSAAGPTVVVAVAVLLPVIGSTWLALTTAVATMVPCAVGVALIVADARPPLVRVPKLQTTMLPIMVEPWDGVTEFNMTLKGNVLVTVTLEAVDGPLLVTETV